MKLDFSHKKTSFSEQFSFKGETSDQSVLKDNQIRKKKERKEEKKERKNKEFNQLKFSLTDEL